MSLRALSRAVLTVLVSLAAVMVSGLATGTLNRTLTVAGSVALLLCAPVAPIMALRWLRPPTSAMMLWTRKELASRWGGGQALAFEWVDLEHISRVMWLAAIAAEDA